MLNDNLKLNFRLTDIFKVAFNIAIIDGGFIIAIQVINFLLAYFGARFPTDANSIQALSGLSKTNFLIIIIITMLNLAVIIYRITGLTRGVKHNIATCYKQAFKRGPMLIMLYLLGGIMLLTIATLAMRLLGIMDANTMLQYNNLIMFVMLSLIPYGILACTFVVDQEKNPLQAIKDTFKIIKDKLNIRLLINLSTLYTLPFCLSTVITAPQFIAPYVGLFNAIWILFCHIITIVIYTSTNVIITAATDKQTATKIIVI